ncbi:helix-turn-helix transcriptional regulator [Microbacterium sp. RG1]|uniref:helix-turn-helix transcriptional regulator n=1 Tax=Microbacterium sp. RG1 TaxID=2489212 RepID=UPI0010CA5B1B|nr:helix-turn-helix domain-containing protein [Microbacterium sp. RG1]QCQ17183.1 DNA-binding protein [Microbacterium sp. RG1]
MSTSILEASPAPLLATLISPATLAEALGTTERTLSEWRIRGTGPAYLRVGRSVRYRPESVDTWLLAQEHLSTAEELCA